MVTSEFSPPYGWYTQATLSHNRVTVSAPYDGTSGLYGNPYKNHVFAPLRWYVFISGGRRGGSVFAPLRDGIAYTHLDSGLLTFSPLAGLYRNRELCGRMRHVFAPLRMVLIMISSRPAQTSFPPLTMVHGFYLMDSAPQGFRPLTGIVHGDDWYFLADAGFRPLMGWYQQQSTS